MRPVIRKAAAITASILTLATMAACSQNAGADDATAEKTVTFGVSGPLTGDQAQYGKDWQAGFELALEELNAEGDTTYAIDFQDSQGHVNTGAYPCAGINIIALYI